MLQQYWYFFDNLVVEQQNADIFKFQKKEGLEIKLNLTKFSRVCTVSGWQIRLYFLNDNLLIQKNYLHQQGLHLEDVKRNQDRKQKRKKRGGRRREREDRLASLPILNSEYMYHLNHLHQGLGSRSTLPSPCQKNLNQFI